METEQIADVVVHGHTIPDDQVETLAQAYLDLLKSQEGMVLVPVEPSEEMIDKGVSEFQLFQPTFELSVRCIYKAMIGKAND